MNRAMNPNEFIDFADKHAGVMAMSKQNINPYKIGIELMRDIEYRWDTGRFGKDYNECPSLHDKENWDIKTWPRARKDI
jgi:stage V sporulation protein R